MRYYSYGTEDWGMTRRNFVQIMGASAMAVAAGALLASCGSQQTRESESTGSGDGEATGGQADEASSAQAAAEPDPSKVLVAYFSGMGHTQRAAEALASTLGADVFVIIPAQPYSEEDLDFNDDSSRVSVEHVNEDQQDTPLAQSTPDGFEEYGTVFVGYPIWWGNASWAMHHFAIDNDFTGKTVIPFCTSYSSGIGSSGENLAEMAGTGDWREGMRFDQDFEGDEVVDWVESLQI